MSRHFTLLFRALRARLALAVPLSFVAALACGTAGCFDSGEKRIAEEGTSPLPARRGSIIVEACTLDAAQRATLETPGARRLLRDIVLLCLTVDENGQVSPTDTDRRTELAKTIAQLRGLGYRVLLGAGLGTSRDSLYTADRASATLASQVVRSAGVAELSALVAGADGVDLHLAPLQSASQGDLTAYVKAVSAAVGKDRVELFLPPSQRAPSDLPGGEAFDVAALAPLVSRLRVMTLDYSCCDGAGPTIDPSWALDVMGFLRTQTGNTPLDFSYPLYGTDFGPNGQRSVTWLEAAALAQVGQVSPRRTSTGAPTFAYTASDGVHEVFYDDAVSTSLVLSAFDGTVLPNDVGVVFYGLGAEQPGLFDELSRLTP